MSDVAGWFWQVFLVLGLTSIVAGVVWVFVLNLASYQECRENSDFSRFTCWAGHEQFTWKEYQYFLDSNILQPEMNSRMKACLEERVCSVQDYECVKERVERCEIK